MVSSPQQCCGMEGKVYGQFLPSKEHDPHRLCVSCQWMSCHQDNRCDECHDWTEERCKDVTFYEEKLSAQREKKESKTNYSSLSFWDFIQQCQCL